MAEFSLPFESRYFPVKKFLDIYHRSLDEPEEFGGKWRTNCIGLGAGTRCWNGNCPLLDGLWEEG